MRIGIVGAGIAGSTLALLLGRAGHSVEIFEKSPQDFAPGGGLVLQPAAQAILRALGLGDGINDLGAAIEHVESYFVDTRQTLRLDYREFSAASTGCGVQRGALLNSLRTAVGSNATYHWQTGVKEWDPRLNQLKLTNNHISAPFNLIVAADGVNSQLRKPNTASVTHYAEAAVVCLVDQPDNFALGAVRQRFVGNTHVATWPVGRSDFVSLKQLSIAMSVSKSELTEMTTNEHAWRKKLNQLHPDLAALLNCRTEILPPRFAYTYSDVRMKSFVSSNMVLIGDAAHAMSPQLGLGASLALEDAWMLAHCIKTHGEHIAPALLQYNQLRLRRLEPLQQLSQMSTRFFLSERGWISTLRAHTASLIGHSSLFRNMALQALCSVPRELGLPG